VNVGDFATFGGLAAVGPHVRVGTLALVAAGAMCERDVPPYVIVQGDRARVRGVNRVGMKRRGYSREEIREVERAFRALYRSGASVVSEARSFASGSEAARAFARAICEAEQGLFASVRAGRHLRA
jgi:UDP-N-acetylglucosamine acyltransferase